MFLTKLYKIRYKIKFCIKATKTAPASMVDANNISARSYLRHIRLKCLQTGSNRDGGGHFKVVGLKIWPRRVTTIPPFCYFQVVK